MAVVTQVRILVTAMCEHCHGGDFFFSSVTNFRTYLAQNEFQTFDVKFFDFVTYHDPVAKYFVLVHGDNVRRQFPHSVITLKYHAVSSLFVVPVHARTWRIRSEVLTR